MFENSQIVEVSSINELSDFGFSDIVAAIGVFDGIHLGHRKLISRLISMSETCKADPVIITFHPHPRIVLMHDTNLRFLRNPESKTRIMLNLGIKAVVTIPFTKGFASLPPKEFIESFMLPDSINLKGICVGSKWKFGRKARGNRETLQKFADEYSFKFCAVDEAKVNGQLISSTEIRKAIKRSDFATANFMLDCNYQINGEVTEIESTEHGMNRLHLYIKYGILPTPGTYFVRTNGIETQAEVLSEDSLTVLYPNDCFKQKKVSLEFVKWI